MRRTISGALVVCGALVALLGAGGLATPQVASAQQAVPQPSPRPPVNLSDESGRNSTAADITGHVTGTVIDQTTGAPVPGATVKIGDTTVTTDASGNYDEWLPVGSYTVELVLDPSRGTAPPPVTVEVRASQATVQHLLFQGVAVAAPTPVSGRAAAAVPEEAAPAEHPSSSQASPPKVLPRTGLEPDESWLWVGFGMLLVLAGWLLWGRPSAQLAPALSRSSRLPAGFDRDAMLAGLLGAKGARRTPGDDLLDELLERDKAR